MTLHPLTSKGGAFVLKLGSVPKRKSRPERAVFSFGIGIALRGIEPLLTELSGGQFLPPVLTLVVTIIYPSQ